MKALELANSIEDSLKYQIKYGRRISELERDIPIAAAELRRLAEVNTELLVALDHAKSLLDRYRLETPMGNQPHMITLEAYECSNAIKVLSDKAKEQQ